MSLSVDDLASSFSSSHIGQEAIDLATLQAQLAQTLFGQPIAHSSKGERQVPYKNNYTQPCNTPTTATSLASNWGGSAGSGSSWNVEAMYDNRSEMEEDERMVEDLLLPSSPMSATTNSPLAGSATQYSSYTNSEFDSPSSSFTSADPFYLAQAQASQNYNAASQSAFSQYGRPQQQSPFLSSPQQHPVPHHHESFHCRPTPPHLSLDTHALFAATAATFNI
ncbi:hypothetical protein BDZ94DRAFT_1244568 [Collybia nuda]|uniref:Uncharacterized protein n=1 Tax=Collybia nuda TaxID=64659 RepID=A0A9P5YGZ0_9AGAR|nr:hypothetical protein BDZ94DRAFT_1244568 [Collybia nuda]